MARASWPAGFGGVPPPADDRRTGTVLELAAEDGRATPPADQFS
jgi:hypothetical protein